LRRVATNRTLIDALRKGTGPLTRTQRFGFFLLGSACPFGGFALIPAGPSVFREVRELAQEGPLSTGLPLISASLVLVIGLGVSVLGLGIIRRVLLRAS
jgi:hypothetical protein